ncbi:MAG: hypothetical protein F6K41_17820 [Symploca sp. SIO3E6]|nr:hypothetical protein [Caldora sp. SIO3E6]
MEILLAENLRLLSALLFWLRRVGNAHPQPNLHSEYRIAIAIWLNNASQFAE